MKIDKAHLERYQQEVKYAEERAAAVMVELVKNYRSIPTAEEVAVVERAMEVAGCNECLNPESRIYSRRVVVWSILRRCIMPTDRYELKKIEKVLLDIANR